MTKRIKSSLTVKICIVMAGLILAASGITYAAVYQFLPAYYSSRLEGDVAQVSREMAETISTYESIQDASHALELFEAGSQVSVVILDHRGEPVWPETGITQEESVTESGDVIGEARLEGKDGIAQEESMTESSDVIGGNRLEGKEDEAGIVEEITEGWTVSMSADIEEAYEESVTLVTVQSMAEGGGSSVMKEYDIEMGGEEYKMFVSGGMQPVNQATGILRQIFPYILLLALAVSVLFGLAASLYLTRPVVRLSHMARKMALLDFTDTYEGKRTDEIGTLGSSLNELAENLSETLEELKRANAKLQSDIDMERENERKRIAFFSAVSHELKTPITILKGHLEGMLQGIGGYRDRDHYMLRCRETADKMDAMVQELLTVSRIETKKFTVKRTDVAELLRQPLAEMAELMEKNGIRLQAEIPEHLYAEVNPGMMEKVFRNLLVNAVRYTPAGAENEIRVVLQGSGASPEAFLCAVENTGVWLPKEALPHLFEAFYRVEQSRSRETGGSGLGLFIVKMALDQHGARYEIRNTEDGVKFEFTMQEEQQ